MQCLFNGRCVSWIYNNGLVTIMKHPNIVVGEGG